MIDDIEEVEDYGPSVPKSWTKRGYSPAIEQQQFILIVGNQKMLDWVWAADVVEAGLYFSQRMRKREYPKWANENNTWVTNLSALIS